MEGEAEGWRPTLPAGVLSSPAAAATVGPEWRDDAETALESPALVAVARAGACRVGAARSGAGDENVVIDLPAPRLDGSIAVERALAQRRSRRRFKRRQLKLSEISQLLWAAQGVTTGDGDRTAPSAGALFPLELTLVAGEVAELPSGLYRYQARDHGLCPGTPGDRRAALAAAAVNQEWVRRAAAVLIVSGVAARTRARYGERAERYVLVEVGAACENVHLEAEALGLGTVMVGAFEDREVREIAELEPGETPFMLMPVGAR